MKKAQELLNKAIITEDTMDRFTNVWQSFNNLFSKETGYERNKIKTFLTKNIDENFAKKIINNFNNDKEFLLSSPVIDMDNPEKDTKRDIDTFNNSSNYLVKLKALFMIIYQVRCNLLFPHASQNYALSVQGFSFYKCVRR